MPTDEQIEAAANVLFHNWPRERASLSDLRELAGQVLAALQGRWYADDENGYESPDEAAGACSLALGQSIVLSENVSLGEDRWQLVPVTDGDALCPCGKPEGCGDFLGVDCDAVRDKAWRWSDLPKEWQR